MEQVVYKVWNDSSHYVATLLYPKKGGEDGGKAKPKDRSDYVSEFMLDFGNPFPRRGPSRELSKCEEFVDSLFPSLAPLGVREAVLQAKRKVREAGIPHTESIVEGRVRSRFELAYERRDRFIKKAFNNRWNYFVTITYDDSKHDEETFRSKLKKCLSNFHSRYCWRYMGVFERSPSGRLHFHGLFWIPGGAMRGELRERRDYSKEDGRMRTVLVNDFFERKFGRNDFSPLPFSRQEFAAVVGYVAKYIVKGGERCFYSRGIPTYRYFEGREAEPVVARIAGLVKSYVLFDDVVESLPEVKLRT